MHDTSLELMETLLNKHALPADGKHVLDVGSQDVNGTYRDVVTRLGFTDYTGIDIQSAKNVDIVIPEREPWLPVVGREFPIVISGQCLEHTRWPWQWFEQVVSLTEDDGLVIIIAPWQWPIHRYPIDCWRILPDGMTGLFEWANITTLEVGVREKDCFGVGRKIGAPK